MILILGGGSSGKSAYAEKRIMEIKDRMKLPVYYIATMKIYGEEEKRIVERHRALREGKGFITIEQPSDLKKCLKKTDKGSAALIECTSNLCANEMFAEDKILSEEETVNKICADMEALNDHFKELVVVSNNIFEDGAEYEQPTKTYISAMGRINQKLAQMALEVLETTAGIPVRIK